MRAFRITSAAAALVAFALLSNCGKKAAGPTAPITPAPQCSVRPSSLDFGSVTVGHGNFVSFTLRNAGGDTLSGSLHSSSPVFRLASDSTYALAAGDSQAVSVQFAPVAEGPQTAVISTSAGCQVSCSGTTPAAPVCQVSVSQLDFAGVLVGSTKELPLTLTNLGGGTLTGALAATGSGFSPRSPADFSLGAGQSVVRYVRFAPEREGPYAGTITLGGSGCGPIPCSGQGAVPALPRIAALDFGSVAIGQGKELTFTVYGSACGSQPYAVCADEESREFVLQGAINDSVSVDCDKNYTINFPRTYSVTFRPSSADSSGGLVYLRCLQDQIDGTYHDFGYVVCTGVGYPVGGTPQCQLSATGINFGTVAVGSHVDRTLTVTNAGGGVLTGSVAPSGCPEFTAVGDPTVALGPGQSATYTIRFTPSQGGHAYTCYAFVGHPYCSMVTYSGQGQ